MFTGIITNLARIEEIKIDDSKDSLLKISINNHKKKSANALKIGSSISCNGICLTLIKKKIIKMYVKVDFLLFYQYVYTFFVTICIYFN